MSFISYAQNFEDVILYRALKSIPNGFYVDIGAQDPSKYSVTKTFYERGWHGINVEPVPFYFNQLQQQRPKDINLSVVITDTETCQQSPTMNFFAVTETGLSTTNEMLAEQYKQEGYSVETINVSSMTLSQVFSQHIKQQEVHFLKIDVEGAEGAVLQGMDFQQYRPWIILIEAIPPGTSTVDCSQWEHFLLAAQYEPVYCDGLNQFYLAAEKIALKEHFLLPPNIYDGFVLTPSHDFCGSLLSNLRELEEELQTTKKQYLEASTKATENSSCMPQNLSLNKVYDFNVSHPFMELSGFSIIESWGRWTKSLESSITLYLDANLLAQHKILTWRKKSYIHFKVQAFLCESVDMQKVILHYGHNRTLSLNLAKREQWISLPYTIADWTECSSSNLKKIVINLQLPNAVTPIQLNTEWQDDRLLAVGFVELIITQKKRPPNDKTK
jgi:FkbM family methyltransferase